MPFPDDLRYASAATKAMGFTAAAATETAGCSDPRIPLMNLAVVQARMDFLQKFLSDSVNRNTLLGQPQMEMVSSEIASAIQQIIVNGAALISSSRSLPAFRVAESKEKADGLMSLDPNPSPGKKLVTPKAEIHVDHGPEDYEVVELDAVELLAEHVHFCEICGKGFKRDANLRMHMRAHGNQFKTPEALAKPGKGSEVGSRKVRFSCPFVGCNRNKQHKKFRPLKSAICVKNHFKRSHCPKMFSCTRCNKKSFSVVGDLKSHLRQCGESKWRCSCGTNFSRKDKLFGHMALFEGHMPAVVDEAEEENGAAAAPAEAPMSVAEEEEVISEMDFCVGNYEGLENKNQNFDGFFGGFGSVDDYCFQDMLKSPVSGNLEGFFDF